MIVSVVALGAGAIFGYQQYRVSRLARMVRSLFASRRYDAADGPLKRWLEKQPGSAEAHYYKAWDALAKNEPREAVEAVDRARKLGFDPDRLDCLAAIYHARADRFSQAEPVLERAFLEELEPKEMVAKELARIYLTSYRLDRAATGNRAWRALAPDDPQPCLWSNEIASRTSAETAVLIQNFRAALDRDPNLDQARLGLAQQLSKDRRFEEAEQEFLGYLAAQPERDCRVSGTWEKCVPAGQYRKGQRVLRERARNQSSRP